MQEKFEKTICDVAIFPALKIRNIRLDLIQTGFASQKNGGFGDFFWRTLHVYGPMKCLE